MKLSVKGMALGLGVLYAVCLFVWGLLATYAGFGAEVYGLLGDVYRGVSTGFGGSLLAGVYGFVDGLVSGALLAWLYNHFSA